MSEENSVEVANEPVTETVVSESADAEQVTSEESSDESAVTERPVDEKVVFNTREEFDNHAAKLKAKAERKLKRKLDAEYQKKYEDLQAAQQEPQSTATVNTVSPGPDYVWDQYLGYIHKDMTAPQYSEAIAKAINSQQTQVQQPVQQQFNNPAPAVNTPVASERLIDQLEDFADEHPDLSDVLQSVNIKLDMLENASLYKDGINKLYEEAKSNPSKVFKISSLTDEKERNLKMFELNDSKNNQKKVTKVPAQPDPIHGGSSIGVKKMAQMNEEELAEKFIREL